MRTVIKTDCSNVSAPAGAATKATFVRSIALMALAGLLACTPRPAFADKVMSPSQFNLKDYKGKVVYLDFWASWCAPCKLSFPYMKYLNNNFADKGLVVIADNLDHSTALAKKFLNQEQADFPVILDQKGVLATRFKVDDMPTSVLIGRDGKIRYRHRGFYQQKEDEYTSHVLDLINQEN